VSVQRGHDPRDFALVAFGGAGPLHAAELARKLAIDTVIVPPHPGTLSALGLLTADVRLDFAVSELHRSDEPKLVDALIANFESLAAQAEAEVSGDKQLRSSAYSTTHSCDVRYRGQAYEVNVPVDLGRLRSGGVGAIFERFHALHLASYGFSSPADECEVVTMRLVASVEIDKPPIDQAPSPQGAGGSSTRSVFIPGDGFVDAAIYDRTELAAGVAIRGPAVIHQADSTTLVPSYAQAVVDGFSNVILSIDPADA